MLSGRKDGREGGAVEPPALQSAGYVEHSNGTREEIRRFDARVLADSITCPK